LEAKELGIETKPVLVGIFTLFKLIAFKDENTKQLAKDKLLQAYIELLKKLNSLGVAWLELDEPYLVYDLNQEDIALFEEFYKELLKHKGEVKILLQSYFGDLRDIYTKLLESDFDALGLDFVEGKESLNLIQKHGFANDKILFAGIVNGKNIYANDYAKSLKLIKELQKYTQNIVINTSCSLLHVPYSTEFETKLDSSYLKLFSFAKEKLKELQDLKAIINSNEEKPLFKANQELFKNIPNRLDEKVKARLQTLKKEDFVRKPEFKERIQI
ncbi:TPA: 5-methyltetrahydropteroyltriglutamate--homocysteine S-methyltransferase, partial [Campylobacter jejuni]|nr:5-methyltetrahydropteroyltriglutamate--homocysteine S-methyltransferase [Campylobacter jejuni]